MRPQLNQGSSPPAELRIVQPEGYNFRMFDQNRVNGATQVPNPFAVDDAHVANTSRLTGRQVIRHKVFDFGGPEGVQIQHAINRKRYGLIHNQ